MNIPTKFGSNLLWFFSREEDSKQTTPFFVSLVSFVYFRSTTKSTLTFRGQSNERSYQI